MADETPNGGQEEYEPTIGEIARAVAEEKLEAEGVAVEPEQPGEQPPPAVSLDVSGYRKVLSNRNFMTLWIAQNISGIGDWVIVGVLLDKVNQSGGASGLAIMMTFRFLPAFLFGLIAGAVVDRLERKTIMIFCDICRALLVFALAFSNTLPLICGLVFGIECFSLLFGPSKDSSIPDLVAKEDVINANSLMSTSTYLTMAIGTMIATVFLAFAALVWRAVPLFHFTNQATFQHTFAFIIDAMTFLASAMLIFTIAFPKRFVKRPEISVQHVWADTKEGLSYMSKNPLTRAILGVMIIGFIGGGSLYILGAPFAEQALGATGAKFTLILTFLLIGVVIGAGVAPLVDRKLSKERWFGRVVVMFGVVMMIFPLFSLYAACLVIICLGGMTLGYLLVTAYTMLHQSLAEDIRGRVFAAMQTIMRTCLLISMGLFAVIAWLFGQWIPWSASHPVHKTLSLGFVQISVYPSMLALWVGGIIVIIGGLVSMRTLKRYFRAQHEMASVQPTHALEDGEVGESEVSGTGVSP